MDPIRRWLAEGMAPADVDVERYRRIVRILAVGRALLLILALGMVAILGQRFEGGPLRFVLALVFVYLPFIVLQTWAGTRSQLGPVLRGVILGLDVGIVMFFTWLFPDLRDLAPYAYLFVVAFTTAMTGLAGGLTASLLAVLGSFVAWPVGPSGPGGRVVFWGLVFAMAILIHGIGRERNEAARAASENEARMEEAQALAHVGSWYWDLRTDHLTSSAELFRIFGYARPEGTGSYAAIVRHAHLEDRARLVETIEDAIAGGDGFEIEYRIVRVSGEVRTIYSRARVVRDGSGRAVAMMGSGQDVTEQREAEAAMRYALDLERRATEHLRSLNEMKNAFLTAVSHELRTPLTVVMGFAQTLAAGQGLSDDEKSDLLERLRTNAEKLDRLLTDLLDIDRLERGILAPNRRPTELSKLIRRVIEELESTPDRTISVELQPLVADIDPAKVERIVENLIANAVRHTPAGTPIWVFLDPDPDGALLTVEDAGPGVPSQLRDSVFEAFQHGGAPHAPGVGIGLSLVARFAELHGGRAWVEERPGGGACFRVLLVSRDGDEDAPEIRSPGRVGSAAAAAVRPEPPEVPGSSSVPGAGPGA